ncbi:MAG: hypothetical protein RID42_11965 [Alphaproteobacteria bacterium]
MKHPALNPAVELKQLGDRIDDALSHAKDGMAVNLSDLEERASALCEYLLALPALEARPYAVKLERLITGLNALEEAIASSFGNLVANAVAVGPDLRPGK